MWSGISALRELDTSLHSARNDLHRLDAELNRLSEKLSNNQRQQSRALSEIAKSRLDAIVSQSLRERLSTADHQAIQLLEVREVAYKKLEQTILELNTQFKELEERREAKLTEANTIASELAEKEAKIQAELKVDESYLAAYQQAQQADSIADQAEIKAEQSAEDMGAKGAPYEADELFMYLWKRKYATPDYRNFNPLTRFMDGWVAKQIKYDDSRQNYWNIQEIPTRLGEHAERQRTASEEAIAQLEQVELDALKKGGVIQLQTDLENIRAEIDKLDAEIAGYEEKLDALYEERGLYSSGQDEHMKRCIDTLSSAMQHRGFDAVKKSAAATPSPNDDDAVRELHQYKVSAQDINDDLRGLRITHDQKLARLKELEGVRRKFKTHRFDDVRSGFGNEAIIGQVLAQFMQGLVNGTDLWRVIQRNQRHRDVGAWPDFGSGGLGRGSVWGEVFGNSFPSTLPQDTRSRLPRRRRSRSGTFHWPNSGNGGFRMPSGRGGFKGGGGFKTGGGF